MKPPLWQKVKKAKSLLMNTFEEGSEKIDLEASIQEADTGIWIPASS